MKLKLLILLVVLSFFASSGFCLDKPTKTLYNNKVSYKSLFGVDNTDLLKVQVITKKGRRIQAEIPVVNDVKKDVTQTKGD